MRAKNVTLLASKVELLLMDVDGVLTDGRILLVPHPGGTISEAKAFHVNDGAGLALAHRAGLKTGLISRRDTPAVARRAEELEITHVYQAVSDKRRAVEDLIQKTGLRMESICYIGDDLVDLPAMTRVGFPVAVSNACPEVKSRAAYVTNAAGGQGAVREVVELILKARGKWEVAIEEFFL
jgi:3-deoxy-D-manno-octulosonate 8-phosphate phosphatase (KDO 8-P phosphatase)